MPNKNRLSSILSGIFAALLVTATGLLSTQSASAYGGELSISVNPSTVPRCGTLTVTASGFSNTETPTLGFYDVDTHRGILDELYQRAQTTGSATFTVVIPADAPLGPVGVAVSATTPDAPYGNYGTSAIVTIVEGIPGVTCPASPGTPSEPSPSVPSEPTPSAPSSPDTNEAPVSAPVGTFEGANGGVALPGGANSVAAGSALRARVSAGPNEEVTLTVTLPGGGGAPGIEVAGTASRSTTTDSSGNAFFNVRVPRGTSAGTASLVGTDASGNVIFESSFQITGRAVHPAAG